ncbi:putative ABC-type transport system, permease component [Vibrio nigripulchritudo SFn118]|nr:putative ABC-type transport system, permease component [Vibrio nigripulchritudo SFn118]
MMLRLLYLLMIVVCIAPTVPGFVGVILSSVNYIPPLGYTSPSVNGFAAVFEWSGVWESIFLTLFTTLVSTILACLFTFFILQASWRSTFWRKVEFTLSPLLALPHVAFAIGFSFLFAPTGMIVRALHPLLDMMPIFGSTPWDFNIVHNQQGWGLIAVLTLKEIPFLLLMSIPILQQLKVNKTTQVAHSLGYNDAQMWWKCIFPQWLPKLRFPLLAVLAYGASVVDLSLIVGPTNPPTFAVLVWQWFNDPDLALLPRAAAGAVILFLVCALLIAVLRGIETGVVKKCRYWQFSGRFGLRVPGKTFFLATTAIAFMTLPLMVIWSFAQRWRFPDLFPTKLSERFWATEWEGIVPTILDSLSIAIISSTIALILALIGHEYRLRYRVHVPGFIIAIPMLVPQLSILFGLQITTLLFSTDAYYFWVCWAHVFFAFPYVFLSLDGPWRSYDNRLTQAALSLGKSPFRAWWSVKAHILFPAIIYAWAVGISVSLAQYLPTLMLGAGRIATITTEAVALTSGHDRRVTAIYALWQALLPLIFFSFAMLTNQLQNRRLRRTQIVRTQSLHDASANKPRHP